MSKIEVTKEFSDKSQFSGREATVGYDFGDDLDEMSAKFTPEVVYHHAKRNMVISLRQPLAAKLMKDGWKDVDYQKIANEWKPTIQQAKDPKERSAKSLAKLPKNERYEVIAADLGVSVDVIKALEEKANKK